MAEIPLQLQKPKLDWQTVDKEEPQEMRDAKGKELHDLIEQLQDENKLLSVWCEKLAAIMHSFVEETNDFISKSDGPQLHATSTAFLLEWKSRMETKLEQAIDGGSPKP